jgi:hypothetical protein
MAAGRDREPSAPDAGDDASCFIPWRRERRADAKDTHARTDSSQSNTQRRRDASARKS